MAIRFDDESTYATRALQAYLILISRAHNEQRCPYPRLAELMSYGVDRDGIARGGVLGHVLAPVMRWCDKRGFPALTVLVHGEDGKPGEGLTTVAPDDWPAETKRVFAFKWFEVFPPTLLELAELSGREVS
jgi:hypothetical protein